MTRQVTDQLYIEIGYHTPEEYYVYNANAELAVASAGTLSCNAGKVIDAQSALTVTVTETAAVTKVIEFACDFGALFAPSMTAEALKNHTAVLDTVVSMSVNAVANKSATITLDNIINQSSQAVKTTDVTSTQSATLTQTTTATSLKLTESNLSSSLTIDVNGVRVKTAQASLSTVSTISARGFKSYEFPWLLKTTNGSLNLNTTTKQFGLASLDGASVGGASLIYSATDDIPNDQGFAVDFWYRQPSSTGNNLAQLIVSNETGSPPTNQFSMGVSGSSAFFNYRLSNGTDRSITSATNSIVFGNWYYLAFVYDSSLDQAEIWINGTRVITDTNRIFAATSGKKQFSIGIGPNALIDEVRVSYGAPSSIGSFSSVPSSAYPYNTETTRFLAHFDNNFNADFTVLATTQAALSAVNQINISAVKSTGISASLSSAFTQTTAVTSVIDAVSNQQSTVTQNTDIDRIRYGLSDLSVAATESVIIGTVKQFSVAVSGALQSTVDADATLRPLVYLESQAVISVTAEKITDVVSAHTVVSTQTASILYTANAQSSQTVAVSQTVDNSRVRYALADFNATAAVAATGNKIPPFSSNMTVTAGITAEATKFKRTDSQLSVTVTANIDAVKTVTVLSALATASTQSTESIRVRFANSQLTSAFAQTTAAVKSVSTGMSQSVTVEQTALAVKTVDADIDNLVAFGSSIDADLTARPLVYLETQAVLTAIIGSIKDTRVGPDIKGIEFNNSSQTGSEDLGDNWLYIRDQKFVLDTASTDTFLIAFWAKDPLGVILTTGIDFSQNGGYFKFTANSLIFEGLRGTGFGQTNDRYAQTWSGLTTTGWHHYVIYQTAAMSTARLYIDGEAQAVPSVINTDDGNSPTFSATKAIGLYRPNNPSGQFVLRWCLGERIINWYDSVNDLTNVFKSSESFQGSVYQFVAYFDSGTPNGLDQRVINKIYSPVTRNLGTSGTDTGLAQPRLYLRLLDYTDIENRGSLTLENTVTNIPDWYTITDLDVLDNLNQSYIQASDYTESIANNASDLEPGLLIESDLVASFIGVFLFAVNLSTVSAQTVSVQRLRGTLVDLPITATMTTAVTVTAGAVVDQSVTVTMSTTVSKFTGYASTQAVQFTQATIIGLLEQGQIALSDQFDFVCDFNALAPIRAEADLSVTAQLVCDPSSFTDMISLQVSAASLTADVTVIPPIRTSANLTATATMSVTIGSIEQFAVLTQSMGTMTVQPVFTARPQSQLTSTATVASTATKRTGIVANLTVSGFQLTQGDVINIDPFLTLVIPRETGILKVKSETRILEITEETRSLIVEGWE